MTRIREGQIEYQFGPAWTVSKYDQWPFYRDHFQNSLNGNKAVDVVAHDAQDTLWLVELKDYRVHPRAKTIELVTEIALKVRDSLAGLMAAAKWGNDHEYGASAQKHLTARKLRVVLHLEQPARHSKLFSRDFDLARLQQRLKQVVKSVDAHPAVIDLATFNRVPWAASTIAGADE